MQRNPYAAPTTDVDAVELAPNDLQLAGKGRRFLNMAIDFVCYYILLVVFVVVAVLVNPTAEEAIDDVAFPLTTMWMLAYYVGFEFVLGRTPGKLITGTRVVTEDGRAPSFRQIAIRSISRLVPFEPFSCLGDPPEGWHDRWSRTYVVTTRPDPSRSDRYRLSNGGDQAPPRRGTLLF